MAMVRGLRHVTIPDNWAGPIPGCMSVMSEVGMVSGFLLFFFLILRVRAFRTRNKNRRRAGPRRLLQRQSTSASVQAVNKRIHQVAASSDVISIVSLVVWVAYGFIVSALFLFSPHVSAWFTFALIGYGVGYSTHGLFLASKFLAVTPNLANSGSERDFKLFLAVNTLMCVLMATTYEEEATGCIFAAVPTSQTVIFAISSLIVNFCGFRLFRKPFRYLAVNDGTRGPSPSSSTKQIIRQNYRSMCITATSTVVCQILIAITGENPFLFKNVAMPFAMVDVVLNTVSINVAFGDFSKSKLCGRRKSQRASRKVTPVNSPFDAAAAIKRQRGKERCMFKTHLSSTADDQK